MDTGLMSVPISGLPSPDDILAALLGRLVVVGLVILVVCTAVKLLWSGRTATPGPISLAAGAVTAILLTGIQILWLWTCYVIGNGWSYFLFNYLDAEISRSGGTRPVPNWERATESLDWDPFTVGYVGVCCLALVAAYAFLANHPESARGRVIQVEDRRPDAVVADDPAQRYEAEPSSAVFGDGSGIFYLIMAPSLIFGAVGAVVTTLAVVTALFEKLNGKAFTLGAGGDNWASLTAALLITSLATALVMQAPDLIFRAWRSTPE
jgi:hypothetical protein